MGRDDKRTLSPCPDDLALAYPATWHPDWLEPVSRLEYGIRLDSLKMSGCRIWLGLSNAF